MENEWLDQNRRFLELANQFNIEPLDIGASSTEVIPTLYYLNMILQ
jgi:hypothetical protein